MSVTDLIRPNTRKGMMISTEQQEAQSKLTCIQKYVIPNSMFSFKHTWNMIVC
jgi:hypothetical protein